MSHIVNGMVCLSFTLLMMLLLPGLPTMGLNRICKKKKYDFYHSSGHPMPPILQPCSSLALNMVCDEEFTEVQVHTEIENVSDVQLIELSVQQQMDIAIQLSMTRHQPA